MRIIDHFDNAVRFYPNNRAFVDVGNDASAVTYAQAAPVTQAIAGAIAYNGFSAGGHVGILAPNCTVAFLALLGVFRARCVWLPVNPRNTVAANVDLFNDFEGELLLFHSTYANEAAQLKERCPGLRELVCIDGDCGVGTSLAAWSQGAPANFTPAVGTGSLDDTFALYPTGGTTGKSKGVMITHRNIHTFFSNFYAHFDYHDSTCHLVVAPMTHTAGLTGCLHFARGGTNAIMAGAVPEAVADAIEKYKVTHLFLPPTVLYMLLALPDIRQRDYSSLKHFLVGAAPTSLEKLKEAVQVFGPVMSEAFGQSEAPAAITAKAPWDYIGADGTINEARLQSIGRPCVLNTVAILNDEGEEVVRGDAGEICIRGDLVTPGYFKNPQATAEVRQQGWHHTGDVGVMAEDGYITIVDRMKDMIITGGFNVYPNEIEQVLTTHDAVQDCSVIGIPDDKWGEAVKAIVQLKPGRSCTADDLIALVKERLGSVKTPKSVDFIEQLPRSPAGKVLKTELRKAYWEGKTRAVH
ncbi:AMP-binding protein [Pseudomonas laurylsulfatiphila]|uniref:AMP-binding protein n=1 Tax=Pseudomonas laurylsulfatiphila TaxID=2011015 RepID=UPI003D1A7C7B